MSLPEPALTARPFEPAVAQADGGADPYRFAQGTEAFGWDAPAAPHTEAAPSPLCCPYEDAHRELRTEVLQLRRAMQTRPAIDQACGMLMATFGLSPQTAWSVLVTTSQHTNTKLHRLASDLIATIHGDPLPARVQERLAAAVQATAT